MLQLQFWRTYLLYKFSSKYWTALKNALVWKWISQKLKRCGASKNSVHWSKNVRNSLIVWTRANHKTQLSWKIKWNPKDDQPMGFESLSLFSKVTIIKTFLTLKMLYISTILETPEEIIKQMERMIDNFLCKRPDKVTRPSVINSLQNGGLNLTILKTQIKALRLSWVPRVLDERVGPWISNFVFYLKKYGGNLLLKCNCDVRILI